MPAGGSKHEEGRDAHMGNLTRIGFVLGAAALVLTAGCEGCNPPTPEPVVQCSDVTVSFTAPTAATVDSPFDVSIEAKAPDGTAFDFEGAKLTVDTGTPIELAVSGSTATFSAVTAAGGAHTLTVTITKGACGPDAEEPSNKTVPATKTVTVSTPCTAKVTGVTFPQDANGDGRLNSVELPAGTDMQVRVAASCATGVQARVKRDAEVVGALTDFTSGVANVAVPVTADGTLDLFGELLSNGAALNTPVSNPEALASIIISRTKPECDNTTAALNGPGTDQTTGNSTFDLRATATVGPNVTSALFRIENGASSTPGVPAEGAVVADFALPQTTATYNLTLEASDAYGNVCTSTRAISVDFTPLVVTITTPTVGDGGVAATGATPINVVASVTKGGSPYSCVTVDGGSSYANCAVATRQTGSGSPSEVDTSSVIDGSVTMTVPFPASSLYVVEVRVTDILGNVGTAQITIDVALTTCGVGFTQPAACPITLFPANLTSGNYFFTFSSANCVGHTARLVANGSTYASGVVGGGGSFGPNPISFGASGTVTVRGEVDNQVGSPSYVECVVTADLSQPVITSPVPTAPATSVVINASQDSSTSIPGAQRLLTFTASIPDGARADMCTTQQVDPVTTSPRGACADGASGWYQLQSGIVTPGPSANYSLSGFTFPEGTYQVRVVVVSGSATNVSAPISLVVDATPPCVSAAGLTFDRDNGAGNNAYAGDARLNAAEYAQSSIAFLSFALGCGDTPSALSPTSPLVVRQILNGASTALPIGATASPTATASGYTVSVSGLSGNELLVFWVQLTDAVGNTTSYKGVSDPAAEGLTLALTLPICSISSPSASTLGQAQVPSGALSVSASTDTATSAAFVLGGPSPASQNAAVSAGVATTTFNGITGENTWTLDATCTDLAGNSTVAARKTVQVDLVSPTVSFQSPTNAGLYTSLAIPTTINVTGADGQTVTVTSSLAVQPVSTPVVVSGMASDPLSQYPKGAQTLTASVVDPAGNSGSAIIGITVNDTACTLAPTNVFQSGSTFYINRTYAPSGTASFTATSDCLNAPVTLNLLDSGGSPINPPVVAGTSGGAGAITLAGIAVADGQVYRLTIDNGAGLKTSRDYTIDIVAPTFSGYTLASGSGCASASTPCTSTTSAPTSALYFVAATTNRNTYANPNAAAAAGYLPDSAPGGSPAAHFYATVNGAAGVAGGTVKIRYRGTEFGKVDVPAAQTAAIDIPLGTIFGAGSTSAVVIPHVTPATGEALTIELEDVGGNITTAYSVSSAVVDVVKPGVVSISSTNATRDGALSLGWGQPVYSDGTDSASGAVTYEVGWTNSTVASNNNLATEADYLGTSVQRSTVAGPVSALLQVPPLNTYYATVRAFDAVGNYSDFAAASVVASPWTVATLTSTSPSFGATVLAANVVGDATADVIVAAPGPTLSAVGAVYVYTGGSGLASMTGCTTGCQAITPPGGGTGQFGSDISAAGNVSDLGSPNDLLVGQARNGTGGRAFIFFGTASGSIDTTNYVEIAGDSASTFIGQTAKIIKDIDGDGRDEVILVTPTWAVTATDVTLRNVGRAYIFKGRDQAAWLALPRPTPLAYADWVIDGPARKCNLAGTSCGNALGTNRAGLVSLGKVDGNGAGANYFTIPMSRGYWSTEQIWKGAAVAAVPYVADAGIASSSAFASLTQSAFDSSSTNGFGFAAASGSILDMNSPATPFDLAVSNPSGNRVYIFTDMLPNAGNPFGPAYATIDGTNSFGGAVALGDLNNDGRLDLIASETNVLPTAAWVVYQGADGGFPGNVAGFQSAVLRGGTGSFQGSGAATGNVTGHADSRVDLIVGDSALQTVTIWK
jgi:hypothetical protein